MMNPANDIQIPATAATAAVPRVGDPTTRSGRPRSRQADEAILEAGRQLVAEVGYSRMSMDQVARRAGVGKDTLYRRWPSKLVLVRDGILRSAMEAVPVPKTDDPRRDLVVYLTRVAEFGITTTFGSVVAGMVGEAYRNPELATAFQEWAGSRRETVETLLRRVLREQGSADPSDLEMEVDLLLAPLYYRRLVSGAPVDGAMFDALVARLLPAEATTVRTNTRKGG
jgi:AcrR family transcriptional regulator